MNILRLLPVLLATVLCTFCTQKNGSSPEPKVNVPAAIKVPAADLTNYSRATFAAGCFWCVEAVFESVKGVAEVVSGYSGGTKENPTYEEVGAGETGHTEAVEIYYDSSVVDYPTLLKVFFLSQDPTQVNGQGPDHGEMYRSAVFYRNPTEKDLAVQQIADLNHSGKYNKPIAVEVTAFTKFWLAEDYHQDYVRHNPNNAYVRGESIPRLRRAQKQIPELIKPGHSIVDN